MIADDNLAAEAMREALEKFPQFAEFEPRMAIRPVYNGITYAVEYVRQPPPATPGIWDFQNAVVKGYKRLAGRE